MFYYLLVVLNVQIKIYIREGPKMPPLKWPSYLCSLSSFTYDFFLLFWFTCPCLLENKTSWLLVNSFSLFLHEMSYIKVFLFLKKNWAQACKHFALQGAYFTFIIYNPFIYTLKISIFCYPFFVFQITKNIVQNISLCWNNVSWNIKLPTCVYNKCIYRNQTTLSP